MSTQQKEMGHEVETVKREVSQMKAEVNGIKNQI